MLTFNMRWPTYTMVLVYMFESITFVMQLVC